MNGLTLITVFDNLILPLQKPAKKEVKKDTIPKTSAKRKSKDGDEDGSKKRKQKKKKDPNAPKRAMSGFMFFSQNEREVSYGEW